MDNDKIKLFAKLNGSRKAFNSLNELREEIKIYGKTLISLSLKILDVGNNEYHELSLLSACNYISTGEIPEKHKGGK